MSDGQTNVLMDRQTDIFNKADKVMGQTDRVSDRRRERQTDEMIDRQTDRVMDIWSKI